LNIYLQPIDGHCAKCLRLRLPEATRDWQIFACVQPWRVNHIWGLVAYGSFLQLLAE